MPGAGKVEMSTAHGSLDRHTRCSQFVAAMVTKPVNGRNADINLVIPVLTGTSECHQLLMRESSQCVCRSGHHVVHTTYIQFSLVSHTSVKLKGMKRGKKEKGKMEGKRRREGRKEGRDRREGNRWKE